jgi:hypothetical protein
MRIIRTLAIVIVLVGAFYFGVGVLVLFTFESGLELMELAQRSGMKEAQSFDPATWRAGFIYNGATYTLLGTLAILSGIGLFSAREWARKLWLGVTILFALVSLLDLISHYRSGLMDRGDWVGLGVISAVICVSWLYLTKASTVSLFRPGR